MSVVDFPDSGMRHIKAFDVDGYRLSNGRYMLEIEKRIPDGLVVDKYGQIYCSSADGVIVFNPNSGQLIGKIPVPEVVSNCTFNDT